MFRRITPFATLGALVLSLAACGETPQPQPAETQPVAEAPKPAEPAGPLYELTKDDITSHPDWTSRNVTIMGAKIGDKTTSFEKNLGTVENTRTLQEEYLTLYQKNGLAVYTFKLTGKATKFEIYEPFSSKVADEKLKKLLTSGDLKTMREVLGMEEGAAIENADDMSTEYPYDSRGIRFVKYKVGGKASLNAIRFSEIKK